MSANNWTICPNCAATEEKAQAKRKKHLDESYGKVSAGEYLKLQAEYDNPPNPQATLREDWELGVWHDEFFVDYRCSCTRCGWYKEFTHKEKVP